MTLLLYVIDGVARARPLTLIFSQNSVKWIDRSGGKIGVKVNLVDGHRDEGQALRAIQQHYRTTIDDMPVRWMPSCSCSVFVVCISPQGSNTAFSFLHRVSFV